MKILKTLTGSLLFPVCLFFAFTLASKHPAKLKELLS